MIRGRQVSLATLLLFTWGQVFASSPGTTTGELLKIPVGTRAVGMGEAFTALADDSSALYWNPAGMSFMHQKEASFMHTSLFESVHYEHLAFVAPSDAFAFGTNFSYLGYGSIDGYDNAGNATGDVNAYSYIFNGGISRLFTNSFSLGLSGGLIHETLADESANGFVANVGALYALPYHPWSGDYRLGLAAQNLGPGLKFVSERDKLPMRIKVGAAAQGIRKLPLNLTLDVTVPNDNDTYFGFGSEYWFKELVALRLGYAGSNDEGKGVRVGLGLKYNGLLFDYAYAGFGDFGATNRFSLSWRFGEKIRQLNRDERAMLKEAKAAEKDGAYVQAILTYEGLMDKDPSNDHILHYMIKAHDRMAKDAATNEVAKETIRIPSPEEAVAELIPESPSAPAYAQNMPGAVAPDFTGDDPLGLDKLPEVNALEAPVKGTSDTGFAVPKTPTTFSDTPSGSGRESSASNSPALSPADIYGN